MILARPRGPCYNPPVYGFVIPTFDKPNLVVKCVATLRAWEPDRSRWFAVVVNDGAPARARTEIAAALAGDPAVAVVLKEANEGFSKTCNVGVAEALGRGATRVVLTNDDIIFNRPVIDAMESAFASDPRVGVVGAKLLYPDGTLQHAGMARSGRLIGHRFYGMPSDTPEANVPCDMAVTGALMAIRAETAKSVGPLDDGYFMTCEDTDYCVAAIQAGWRVVYWPRFSAIHAEGATRGRTERQKAPHYRKAEREGYVRLYGRWGHLVKEAVKVGPRPPVVWAIDAEDGKEFLDAALCQARAIARRGWATAVWRAGPGAPGAGVDRDLPRDAAEAALLALRGIKVAASPRMASAVARSLRAGDAGYLLVPSLPDALDGPARGRLAGALVLGLRPLCAHAGVARALGTSLRLNPAFVGQGEGPTVADALEDVFDTFMLTSPGRMSVPGGVCASRHPVPPGDAGDRPFTMTRPAGIAAWTAPPSAAEKRRSVRLPMITPPAQIRKSVGMGRLGNPPETNPFRATRPRHS